jgi:hypothetical protein
MPILPVICLPIYLKINKKMSKIRREEENKEE